MAARGREDNKYPWKESEETKDDRGCYNANYKPGKGNYTKDGNLISTRVGAYTPNSNGLYDMAGNVAEWTSTAYTESGVLQASDINPDIQYNAAPDDPYAMKKKVVRGGSWKDVNAFIVRMPVRRSIRMSNVRMWGSVAYVHKWDIIRRGNDKMVKW